MLPLIDGDIIRYRIGWACEYDVYTDVDTGQEFRGIKAYKDWLKESEKSIEDVDFTVDHVLDPIENCLHSVKHTIDFIRRRCKSKKYVIYLTGKNNFREKLATIKKYKGNRPDLKPTHYKDITDYLINVHGAIVIDGMEADDAMAIYQSAMPNTCIVSTDKDLKQIPGWHFNFVNDGRRLPSCATAISMPSLQPAARRAARSGTTTGPSHGKVSNQSVRWCCSPARKPASGP